MDRITHDELHTMAAEPAASDVRRLVAEVRRLRRLISTAGQLIVHADAWCPGCQRTLTNQRHAAGCEVAAIEAEA